MIYHAALHGLRSIFETKCADVTISEVRVRYSAFHVELVVEADALYYLEQIWFYVVFTFYLIHGYQNTHHQVILLLLDVEQQMAF